MKLLPVVDRSTEVPAGLDVYHKNAEAQKPQTHAAADAVHRFIAHKHLTPQVGLENGKMGARSVLTEAWNLQEFTGE